MKAMTALSLFLMLAWPSGASAVSTGELIQACNKGDASCDDYIKGVVDSAAAFGCKMDDNVNIDKIIRQLRGRSSPVAADSILKILSCIKAF